MLADFPAYFRKSFMTPVRIALYLKKYQIVLRPEFFLNMKNAVIRIVSH